MLVCAAPGFHGTDFSHPGRARLCKRTNSGHKFWILIQIRPCFRTACRLLVLLQESSPSWSPGGKSGALLRWKLCCRDRDHSRGFWHRESLAKHERSLPTLSCEAPTQPICCYCWSDGASQDPRCSYTLVSTEGTAETMMHMISNQFVHLGGITKK